jgi:hypothetical protein
MRGTRDDGQPRHGRHPLHGFAIELDDRLIVSADDEQRRRSHERKGVTGKIGSAAARHDGVHAIRALGCCDERGRGARARAETAEWQPAGLRVRIHPIDRGYDTVSKAFDVEPKLPGPHVDGFLLRCQQIEQQCGEPAGFKGLPNLPVAVAETAAAAAVSEDDEPGGPLRYAQITVNKDARNRYANRRRLDCAHQAAAT